MRIILAAFLAAMVWAVPAAADPGGKGHQGKDREAPSGADLGMAVITAAEQALIREYFRDHPGVMVGDSLPPGIRKKVARGKPLPPGIAKKMPGGLAARLAPPPGYGYRVVGADVLLVQLATGVIADLLRDVLR